MLRHASWVSVFWTIFVLFQVVWKNNFICNDVESDEGHPSEDYKALLLDIGKGNEYIERGHSYAIERSHCGICISDAVLSSPVSVILPFITDSYSLQRQVAIKLYIKYIRYYNL